MCVCVYTYIHINETCGLNLHSTYVFIKELPFFTLETQSIIVSAVADKTLRVLSG
jgi:hypothetical protein